MSEDDRKFIEKIKKGLKSWAGWPLDSFVVSYKDAKRLLSIIESQEARVKELETELKNRSGAGV